MLRIGTCSWKYESWRDIVYSNNKDINFLEEYSENFDTVEIDQWFWSLFDNKILLPDPVTVKEYKNSIPDNFKFTVKVPNSITLTHPYSRDKNSPAPTNPHFLSVDLFDEFLRVLKPLENNIASFIFQFEYLNKHKMPSLSQFENKLYNFFNFLPKDVPPIALEIRNPNYLSDSYFKFLSDMNLYHVFLEGYYMPPIQSVFQKYGNEIKALTLIRLHGPDRKEMEKISKKNWNQIYIDRDENIVQIVEMIRELQSRKIEIYLNINNHYEGSAPLTINKFKKLLQ